MVSLNHMPGYRESEYQLVLLPHEELRSRIIQYRKDFANQYQLRQVPTAAHLTLVRFSTIAMQEEKFRTRFKQVAMGIQPFKVEIRNFGSYPTHSIWFNVVTRAPIESLTRELKVFRKLMKTSQAEPHFLEDPNFLLARKLVPWQYEQAWKEYSHRSFTARFIAEDMMLLKKTAGSSRWQVVERFEFMNLPVLTKQGELF